MSLLVVGSLAFDTIETPHGSGRDVLGGSAVHFSAASSFFAQTQLVGVVGEDFDMKHLDFLKERNADLGGVSIEHGKTFRWSGSYHENMNDRDTLSTDLNVFEHFRPRIPEEFRDSEFLFLANINPDLQIEVLSQVSNPAFIALDTMNFWIEGCRPALEQVLNKVDCVILNDSEAKDFSGESNLANAAKAVAGFGPEFVIIKKGEHGSMLYHDGSFFLLPAFLLESVTDPTGAGDSFAGGFMGYIARQGSADPETIRTAMAYGTCMASFCCEDFGSGRFIGLTTEEIDARFETFKKMISL